MRATYAADTDLPATFAVKLSAQDDAVRERVALGYRSEVEYYARVADRMSIPVPPCFYSEISDDGADFVLILADMAPAVQGDQIAGCSAAGGDACGRGARRTARPQLVRSRVDGRCRPIAMPKPGDDAAARGLGEISRMAAGIWSTSSARRSATRTRKPSPPQCLW